MRIASKAIGMRCVACAGWLTLVSAPASAQDAHRHSEQSEHNDTHDHSEHQQSEQAEVVDHSSHVQPSQPSEPTESEKAHVPPDPPANPLPDMSEKRMIELMQMEDDAPVGMLLVDQLEWREIEDEDGQAWELQAWYGTDYNKLWIETEGERAGSEEEGRTEVLFDRIVATWWSVQAGIRQDFSAGPSRTWAAIGMQGMAPYFFEIDTALYIGEQGRTAARFSAEYDVLITQRLVLQPEVELAFFGKDDPENAIGSGMSMAEVGLRLRYEIRRELAPYVGVHWERKFGETKDLASQAGDDIKDLSLIVGIRAWF